MNVISHTLQLTHTCHERRCVQSPNVNFLIPQKCIFTRCSTMSLSLPHAEKRNRHHSNISHFFNSFLFTYDRSSKASGRPAAIKAQCCCVLTLAHSGRSLSLSLSRLRTFPFRFKSNIFLFCFYFSC